MEPERTSVSSWGSSIDPGAGACRSREQGKTPEGLIRPGGSPPRPRRTGAAGRTAALATCCPGLPLASGRALGGVGDCKASVATTRELSLRSEQLRVLLVHRTNIPAQFLSSAAAAELAIAHGTPALPLLSQSAPKPPLMAGARLPCRRRHPRLVARPAPSAPARWPRAASAETAAQLLGGRSEWVQPPGTGIQLPVAPTARQRPTGRSQLRVRAAVCPNQAVMLLGLLVL